MSLSFSFRSVLLLFQATPHLLHFTHVFLKLRFFQTALHLTLAASWPVNLCRAGSALAPFFGSKHCTETSPAIQLANRQSSFRMTPTFTAIAASGQAPVATVCNTLPSSSQTSPISQSESIEFYQCCQSPHHVHALCQRVHPITD